MGLPPVPIRISFFPLLLFFLSLPAKSQFASIKYNGYKLFQLDLPEGNEHRNAILKLLSQLEATGSRFNADGDRMPLLDIWQAHPPPNGGHRPRIRVLVAPEFNETFLELMASKGGLDGLKMVSDDIQGEIEEEKREMIRKRRSKRRSRIQLDENGQKAQKAMAKFDLNAYNSYGRIAAYLRRIAQEHPDFVELLALNKTFEGRDLLGIKIGKRNEDGDDHRLLQKPMIFIDAGIHAREWIAPAGAVYAIDKLVSILSRPPPDPGLHQLIPLLSQIQIVFVPVANPDGYEYSRTRDRLWRKTRSRNVTMHRWCVGADANRNWGFKWAEIGASRSPCSNIFPGTAPFSEPEVRAIRQFLEAHLPQLGAYISLHSYGQLLLSPWGYTATEKPANFADQQKLAELMIDAIRESTGTVYTFGSIADLLYPASGTSIDYWQHRGVPYIYGVELRPEDVDNELHGFAIPPDQIEPTGREVLAIIAKIGEHLLRKWTQNESSPIVGEEAKKAANEEEKRLEGKL